MRLSLVLFVYLFSFGIVAQKNLKKEHPIDVTYKKCLDNPDNQTTIGMVDCAVKAQKAWEAEVVKYYKLLLNKISDELKPEFKKSQAAWLAYKKIELNFSSKMYLGMGGTMWQIVAADNKTEFVKQRALLLKSYYDTLLEKDE